MNFKESNIGHTMKKVSPLIFYPEREGKISQDVILKRSSHDFNPRARDSKTLLADHQLTEEIIDGTKKRIAWINTVLEKTGGEFYACFPNVQKFNSLTALKPKLLDEDVLRERMVKYKKRFEEGLVLMGEGTLVRERSK